MNRRIIHRLLNLSTFYRQPSEFVSGDKAPGNEGWKVELALDKLLPDVFEVLCYTNSGENPNDQLETFYESCAGGVSGNLIVAQDYDIPFEAYLTKDGTSQKLYKNLTKPGLRQNVGIRASNSLMNVQKTFQGTITISTVTAAPNVGMKISGSIKHFSGGITEEEINPELFDEATGTVTIDVPTDTTMPVLYDLTLNSVSITDMVLRIMDGVNVVSSVQPTEGTGQIHDFTGLTPSTSYVVELYDNATSTIVATDTDITTA